MVVRPREKKHSRIRARVQKYFIWGTKGSLTDTGAL